MKGLFPTLPFRLLVRLATEFKFLSHAYLMKYVHAPLVSFIFSLFYRGLELVEGHVGNNLVSQPRDKVMTKTDIRVGIT